MAVQVAEQGVVEIAAESPFASDEQKNIASYSFLREELRMEGQEILGGRADVLHHAMLRGEESREFVRLHEGEILHCLHDPPDFTQAAETPIEIATFAHVNPGGSEKTAIPSPPAARHRGCRQARARCPSPTPGNGEGWSKCRRCPCRQKAPR